MKEVRIVSTIQYEDFELYDEDIYIIEYQSNKELKDILEEVIELTGLELKYFDGVIVEDEQWAEWSIRTKEVELTLEIEW